MVLETGCPAIGIELLALVAAILFQRSLKKIYRSLELKISQCHTSHIHFFFLGLPLFKNHVLSFLLCCSNMSLFFATVDMQWFQLESDVSANHQIPLMLSLVFSYDGV